jgi:hypothetical protein
MELSHPLYEGDRRQDDQDKDKRRRFNPINPVTKKAVSGWLNPTETFSRTPPDPEHRMPVSVVAPENDNGQERTIPQEALRSDVWLGGEVRAPEYQGPAIQETVGDVDGENNDMEVRTGRDAAYQTQQVIPSDPQPVDTPTEEDAFQQLLQQAGLDDLSRSLNQQKMEPPAPVTQSQPQANLSEGQASPGYITSPALSPSEVVRPRQTTVSRFERVVRSQARTRALIAFAAGLLIGSHYGRQKVRPELMKTLEEVRELMAAAPPPEQSRAAPNDLLNVAPEEHIEQDAWHNIVVDEHGHEDIAARQQYGKEFTQEQQEVRQSSASDVVSTSTNAATTSAQLTALSYPTGPLLNGLPQEPQLPSPGANMPTLPSGLTRPQLPTGTPVREDPQHLLAAHTKANLSFIVNPWVWLVAGLLLLVFFAASLIG